MVGEHGDSDEGDALAGFRCERGVPRSVEHVWVREAVATSLSPPG